MASTICGLTRNKKSCYAYGMAKIDLERAYIAVINAKKGAESDHAFAQRVYTDLAPSSRSTMWGRMLKPAAETGKFRNLTLNEAERLATAVGLQLEDVLWRARRYQDDGKLPPER